MNNETLERLTRAVGPKGFSTDPRELAPHLEEWRSKYKGKSSLLLKPASTDEVSAVIAICNETNTAIVPQGGNTGLVGGQIPFDNEVLINLSRMSRIREVDTSAHALTAEAGVILAHVQRTADENDMLFPLSLAAEGTCTIGGNVSTNAGGVNVLRYGMMRELTLGLEIVLADGTVLDLLKTLRKDNSGYDLKQVFIGAEGTLGIVTAATLKLFPKPGERETAFVSLSSPADALSLLARLQQSTGNLVSAFELLPRLGLEFVLGHFPEARDPLAQPAPWYVLIETTGASGSELKRVFESAISTAVESGVATDAAVAESEAQRAALWAIRENISEAQKREGASIKHDVSVPISRIPKFLGKATAAVLKILPDARPVSFGHVGDGNIHFNFSAPSGGDPVPFLAKWDVVQRAVHDIVHEFGGSFSAEHGIGVMKRAELSRYKSRIEVELMRTLKRSFDPKNILNPGKLIPD